VRTAFDDFKMLRHRAFSRTTPSCDAAPSPRYGALTGPRPEGPARLPFGALTVYLRYIFHTQDSHVSTATLDRPTFGEALPVTPAPQVLDFLARRRSASAATLRAPGPDPDELERLLALASRAPDHGKLAPWRFVILRDGAKAAFVRGLEAIAAGRPDGESLDAKLFKIRVPPLSVAVISRFVPGKIPEWEQRLSAGAVCTLMILAAQAMGFGANWITDWYAYDEAALRLLGLGEGEKVAGYIHLGTTAEAPLERVRPDLADLVEAWAPAA
jgi:nitroreductase